MYVHVCTCRCSGCSFRRQFKAFTYHTYIHTYICMYTSMYICIYKQYLRISSNVQKYIYLYKKPNGVFMAHLRRHHLMPVCNLIVFFLFFVNFIFRIFSVSKNCLRHGALFVANCFAFQFVSYFHAFQLLIACHLKFSCAKLKTDGFLNILQLWQIKMFIIMFFPFF